MEQYSTLFHYADPTFQPNTGALLASQVGLALCIAMGVSLLDLAPYLRQAKRRWLWGLALFGLLQYATLHTEYEAYARAHTALVHHSYESLAGRVQAYDATNRGFVRLRVQDKVIFTSIQDSPGVKVGDFVRVHCYRTSPEGYALLQLEKRNE